MHRNDGMKLVLPDMMKEDQSELKDLLYSTLPNIDFNPYQLPMIAWFWLGPQTYARIKLEKNSSNMIGLGSKTSIHRYLPLDAMWVWVCDYAVKNYPMNEILSGEVGVQVPPPEDTSNIALNDYFQRLGIALGKLSAIKDKDRAYIGQLYGNAKIISKLIDMVYLFSSVDMDEENGDIKDHQHLKKIVSIHAWRSLVDHWLLNRDLWDRELNRRMHGTMNKRFAIRQPSHYIGKLK